MLCVPSACSRHGSNARTPGVGIRTGVGDTLHARAGQAELPLLQIELTGLSQAATLERLRLRVSTGASEARALDALELFVDSNADGVFDRSLDQRIGAFDVLTEKYSAMAESRYQLPRSTVVRLFGIGRLGLACMGQAFTMSTSVEDILIRGADGQRVRIEAPGPIPGQRIEVEDVHFAAHFMLSGGGSRAAVKWDRDYPLSSLEISSNRVTGLRKEAPARWSFLLPPLPLARCDLVAYDANDREVARIESVGRPCAGEGPAEFRDVSLERLPRDNSFSQDAEIADMDGDGDPDLLIPSYSRQQDRLYLNDGTGRFTDVTTSHMPVLLVDSVHMEPVDVDGDGDVDVVIAVEGAQNRLLQNDGSGHLTDVTDEPGRMPRDLDYSEDLRAGDLDGDGDLDLVVANLVDSKDQRRGGQIRIYVNDGRGFFEDATASRIPLGPTRSYDVGLADFDGDGDLDLFSANYGEGCSLYRNDGAGVFTDVSSALPGRDLDRAFHTCAVLGDLDGDGDIDVLVGSFQGQSLIYRNDGQLRFSRPPDALPRWDMSTYDVALGDLDGDGDLDAIFANTSNPSICMLNDGGGTFKLAPPGAFETPDDRAYDVQCFDANGDGSLDVLITAWGERQDTLYLSHRRPPGAPGIRVLRIEPNEAPPRGGEWVTLRGQSFAAGMDPRIGGKPLSSFQVIDPETAIGIVPEGNPGVVDFSWQDPGKTRHFLRDAFSYKAAPKGAFYDVTAETLGAEPRATAAVASGDLDSDGRDDVVFADAEFGARVRLSRATGLMAKGHLPTISASANDVALADLDGDQRLDLVVVDAAGPAWIFPGLGMGDFGKPARLTLPKNGAEEVAIADLDADGKLDLVFATNGPEVVLRGDGKGNFTEIPQGAMASDDSRGIALGDMDGDGDPDLVVANFLQAPRLYQNDGKGVFTELPNALPCNQGDQSYDVAVADFDGDDDLDVAIANGGAQVNRLFLNAGKGICSEAPVGVFRPALGGGAHVVFEDVDLDGDWDLFSSHFWGNNHLYWSEEGRLAERQGMLPSSPGGYAGACFGDLDGDGDPDLVLAAFWGGCRVLRNPLRE